MSWYPKAVKRPIKANFTPKKRASTRAVILHVDGGDAGSLFGWFSAPGRGASSHFYVTKSGVVEQYVDADLIAWTTGEANPTTIGIETQGKGTGEWTAPQRAAIVKLLAWICKTYKIPAVEMPNSKPSSRGIGTHRLGCDGNFPATGVQRGRIQRGGGELWSSSRGKVCPGDGRQAQWPGIVRDVAALLAKPKYVRKVVTKPTWARSTVGGKRLRLLKKGTEFWAEIGSRVYDKKGKPWIKSKTGVRVYADKTKGRK